MLRHLSQHNSYQYQPSFTIITSWLDIFCTCGVVLSVSTFARSSSHIGILCNGGTDRNGKTLAQCPLSEPVNKTWGRLQFVNYTLKVSSPSYNVLSCSNDTSYNNQKIFRVVRWLRIIGPIDYDKLAFSCKLGVPGPCHAATAMDMHHIYDTRTSHGQG